MKSKLILTKFLFITVCIAASGQVTDAEKALRALNADTVMGWNKGGVISVNLAQTSLKNWAAGGQNSISVNGIFSVFANYKKDRSVWDNSLNIGYGLLKQGKDADFIKTDDKIDFLSKYGREAFKNVYYAALFNFKTQMTPGYQYPDVSFKISDRFAPAYLLLALGLDYKPNAYFSLFVAPLTAKFTFVTDEALSDAGAFGVTPGEMTRSEFGGYMRAIYSKNDFKNELLKNISFTTKIDLFSNYMNNPQNIDVSWETLIAMKVNKYISVNLNTHLIYDDDINIQEEPDQTPGPRIQFKEIFGAGFSYNF